MPFSHILMIMRNASISLFCECEQTLFVQQTIESRITLATLADEACKCKGVEVTCVTPILIYLAHIQLHCTMLLRGDKTVSSGTFAWQVEVNDSALVVLHFSPPLRCWLVHGLIWNYLI